MSSRVAYDPPVTELRNPIAYHLVPAEIWDAAANAEPFRVASLDDEGFIHLTHGMADLADVGNRYYRADPRPHVALNVPL